MSEQDNGAWGVLVGSIFLGFGIGCVFMLSMRNESPHKPCQCKPAATPAPCCKADECRKELALVDDRFGDVWDELTQLHEDLAKVNPCGCEPSKPCACSDKPACECKPAESQPKVLLPTYRKRCR